MFGKLLWIDGRNSRLDFWSIAVLCAAVAFVALASDGLNALQDRDPRELQQALLAFPGPLLWALPMGWIQTVNAIRRCHDRNKSGIWAFCGAVPIVGTLWQIIDLGLLPGTEGPNDYGPQPGSVAANRSVTEPLDDSEPHGGLAVVDDAYLAAYAQRFNEEQIHALAPAPAAPPEPVMESFGKRPSLRA